MLIRSLSIYSYSGICHKNMGGRCMHNHPLIQAGVIVLHNPGSIK